MNWGVPSSKLSQSYYVIQFLIDITGPYITRNVYFTHFWSHFRHGLIFWGGVSESESIFKLQKQLYD
jgi:hypothetical protein